MSIARFLHVSENQYRKDAPPTALPLAEIPLPLRATAGSAGYDFICPADISLAPGEATTIPTGIRAEMDAGWVLLIFPRSGLGFKYQVRLANTVGIIDSDYAFAANEGHIMVRIVNGQGPEGTPVILEKGTRFCQGVFLPYGLAEEETVQQVRTGGFGSTGGTGSTGGFGNP